ncbi:MAG TPA: hypothetical protein PLA50_00110 [Bacteroidia bacterium]|nr:hypothetical protein [Bacteroidia bacterium]
MTPRLEFATGDVPDVVSVPGHTVFIPMSPTTRSGFTRAPWIGGGRWSVGTA